MSLRQRFNSLYIDKLSDVLSQKIGYRATDADVEAFLKSIGQL